MTPEDLIAINARLLRAERASDGVRHLFGAAGATVEEELTADLRTVIDALAAVTSERDALAAALANKQPPQSAPEARRLNPEEFRAAWRIAASTGHVYGRIELIRAVRTFLARRLKDGVSYGAVAGVLDDDGWMADHVGRTPAQVAHAVLRLLQDRVPGPHSKKPV